MNNNDNNSSNNNKILIIDLGSQFTQLIARRIRELKVYSKVGAFSISSKEIKNFNPNGIILSGSGESVVNFNSPQISKSIYKLNIPILGICYGQQLLCKDFGGHVSKSFRRSYGVTQLEVVKNSILFDNYWKVNGRYPVWMSHGDYVSSLPKSFKLIAKTDKAPYAVIEHFKKNIFGIQFHPEVSHTVDGMKLIYSFITKIACCKNNWKIEDFEQVALHKIKSKINNEKIVLGFSGGIDSTVTAFLIHKVIGSQLYCIFVDNGLLRHNEVKEIKKKIKKYFNFQIIFINARFLFFNALKKIKNSEKKRKTIGGVFIEIFKNAIKRIENVKYLGQGTIYPDIIESSAFSVLKKNIIKSHHNVGGLPNNIGNLKLIEPLKLLFKDEVKKLGKVLQLPQFVLQRHPFPGPGLGIRVIGIVNKKKCNILKQADYIFINILRQSKLYNKVWQAYAALLPVKTVGVMGDSRTYEYICSLRAVTSVDGMTANYVDIPNYILNYVARKIVNDIKGINRVVYDITSKPPSTIEME